MKFIGNLIWLIFGGLESALAFTLVGLFWCVTIIGIPLGKQAFKLALLALWPFDKTVDSDFQAHPVANVLWFIFFGSSMALAFAGLGLLYCITIIGIPLGKQAFKLTLLAAFPFGADID